MADVGILLELNEILVGGNDHDGLVFAKVLSLFGKSTNDIIGFYILNMNHFVGKVFLNLVTDHTEDAEEFLPIKTAGVTAGLTVGFVLWEDFTAPGTTVARKNHLTVFLAVLEIVHPQRV